jgi:hypothetical protein
MRITEVLPQLPPSVTSYLLESMFSALPLPIPNTPAARDSRDAAAVATLVAMRPANAADAMLAVQIILAQATAMDLLRLANQPSMTIDEYLRFCREATSFMRLATSGRSLLLRIQTAREKAARKPVATAPRPGMPKLKIVSYQHRVQTLPQPSDPDDRLLH